MKSTSDWGYLSMMVLYAGYEFLENNPKKKMFPSRRKTSNPTLKKCPVNEKKSNPYSFQENCTFLKPFKHA